MLAVLRKMRRVQRIVLTASGGPFRGRSRADLAASFQSAVVEQLFARHGVPVPNGKPAATVDEALDGPSEHFDLPDAALSQRVQRVYYEE